MGVTSVVSANCHQSRDTYAPCNSLQDRGTCLRSLESRTDVPDGIQIHGNRCVWCQNGPCTGLNQNRCEPKEWLDTKQHSGYEDTSPCECTVKYTRHRSMLRHDDNNWLFKNEDLITTDPECLRNHWCQVPQGAQIGIDRCKVACAAHPQCKSIAMGYPGWGTAALCFLGGDVNDQDNPLYAHGRWDMYDIEEVCEPARPFFEHAQELDLNGVSDRVDVSDDFNTLQGSEMTFAFRATQKSIEQNYERAWDWSRSCGSAHVFADVYTSLRMTFQVYGLGYVTVDNFWELGVEHVYAFVVSNTHMKVYRDGIEMGALAVNGGIGHGVRDQFYIGGSACDSIQRWHANVKWFRVWTEALPKKMIKDLNIPVTTQTPTMQPSSIPTSSPSLNPTSNPSLNPTSSPTSNPTSSPTSKPTTNPSKRPTAEDFIVKVKAFHGEPKDVLDASKLQDQPDVDAEFFGFEHKLTPFTRRLLSRFYDVGEQGFGREEQLDF